MTHVRAHEGHGAESFRHQVFIGGTGRSGTTVLKGILAMHPDILSMQGELRVIVDSGGALDLVHSLSTLWSPYRASDAIDRFVLLMRANARSATRIGTLAERLERRLWLRLGVTPRRYLGRNFTQFFPRDYYFRRLKRLAVELSVCETPGHYIGSRAFVRHSRLLETRPSCAAKIGTTVARYFDDLYNSARTRNHESLWLDDTPYNFVHALQLRELFPHANFIHIYRDPRDVLASSLNFGWGGSCIRAAAVRLSALYGRWNDISRSLPSDSYRMVSLESLAADPHGVLSELCAFLNLQATAAMLSVPLDKVHAGRWRRELSDADRRYVCAALESHVMRLGYEM